MKTYRVFVLVGDGAGREARYRSVDGPVEAKELALPFGALPRMGQKEEPRCIGSDAGGRGGLELTRCPNNPEHDCRHEAHGM